MVKYRRFEAWEMNIQNLGRNLGGDLGVDGRI
jgi:hypothetical protein